MRLSISNRNYSYVRNGLDNLGLLLNLPRLPGEDNASYRARLEDVYAHPGNATYNGLAAALGREFGFSPREALEITSNAPKARVVLTQQTLYLYTAPNKLEAFWFLREPQVETLSRLVTAINDTDHFQATLLSEVSGNELSFSLLQADNFCWVLNEIVPAARSFHLSKSPVIPGTVVFDEEPVFRRYANPPTNPGDFFLDPETGLIKTALLPSGTGKVAYQYRTAKIIILHLPIGLLDLNSTAARNWFFSTVPADVWDSAMNQSQAAFPHPFMQRIISEINQRCPALWGA